MTTKAAPKTVKLPPGWGNGRALAVSPSGAHVRAAGDPSSLCRIDAESWSATPLRPVEGGVGSMRVSDDGRALIECGTFAAPVLELRDASDATAKRVPIPSGARILDWDGGARALLRLDAMADREHAELAWADLEAGTVSPIGLGAIDSVAACAVGGAVLAFVRRVGVPFDGAHVRVRIGVSGSVEELGPAPSFDAYRALLRLSGDRALLLPTNQPWCLVDVSGALLFEASAKDSAPAAACALGDGFVVANGRTRLSRRGPGGEELESWKAKKSVDHLAAAGGRVLVLQAERLDLITPAG